MVSRCPGDGETWRCTATSSNEDVRRGLPSSTNRDKKRASGIPGQAVNSRRWPPVAQAALGQASAEVWGTSR